MTMALTRRGRTHSRGRLCHIALLLNPTASILNRQIRAETVAHGVFGHAPALAELRDVSRSAGFDSRAAHAKPSKGLATDHCARAWPVQIEIADAEFFSRFFQMARKPRINSSRQRVFAHA